MMNIFAKTRPVEIDSSVTNLHSWRFIGEEMEALGCRLDAARASLAKAKTDWARWYWQETLDRLLLQWSFLPALHDGQAQTTLLPRWSLDYDYWEGAEELSYSGIEGIPDRLFDKIFRTDGLDEVWTRHRDARLMRCSCD